MINIQEQTVKLYSARPSLSSFPHSLSLFVTSVTGLPVYYYHFFFLNRKKEIFPDNYRQRERESEREKRLLISMFFWLSYILLIPLLYFFLSPSTLFLFKVDRPLSLCFRQSFYSGSKKGGGVEEKKRVRLLFCASGDA